MPRWIRAHGGHCYNGSVALAMLRYAVLCLRVMELIVAEY